MSAGRESFSIVMPCGTLKVLMGLHQLMPTIAHQVVNGQIIHSIMPPDPTRFAVTDKEVVLDEELRTKTSVLREITNLQKLMVMSKRIDHEKILEDAFKFMTERFKEHVSKKTTEFHIADLDLKSVENLGVKYMENFGADDGSICIFKLSDYHKFAAVVDGEAFRFYRNDHGTHGELVELRPDRWVLGRYDNDMKFLHEMSSMRRYSNAGYDPRNGPDGSD